MQSYFGSLSDNNGSLDLLDGSQDVSNEDRSLDISNSLATIGLQTSSAHHALEQAGIALHSQNELFADEDDLFICGRCKQQFTDLQLFLQHKRDECVLTRQHNLQHYNENLLQELQQTNAQQQNPRSTALPGAAVLFTPNQDLLSQGQQSHSIMISTNPCQSQNMEEPNGLNLTQEAGKAQSLTQPTIRSTMSNLNLLACEPGQPSHITINQVGNLVQIQGSHFQNVNNSIYQRNLVASVQDVGQAGGIVLSEDMLISSAQTQNEYMTDAQLSRLQQQSEANNQEFNQIMPQGAENGNAGAQSFLQQIQPNQLQQQNQVLIMQPPMVGQTLPQKDILNGLNLSTVNATQFAVAPTNSDVQDHAESIVPQNLTKVPISPRHKTQVVSGSQKSLSENLNKEKQSKPQNENLEASKPIEQNPLLAKCEKGNKKYTCKFCPKAFTRAFDLDQHVRSHTGEKPFQCIVCGRAFSQKSNVKKHMATHKVWPKKFMNDAPNILVVKETNKEKEETREMEQETTSTSASEKVSPGVPTYKDALAMMTRSIHTCPYCYKMLSSYKERKSHMLEHKDQQVYKCVKENCDETFPDLDTFIEHVKSHDGELTYKCHHCHEVFESLHDLGIHQYQRHLNTQSKPGQFHSCNVCPAKFPNADLLQKHIATESHNHTCNLCQKRFSCDKYLRKHLILMHSDNSRRRFRCEVCGKTVRSEYYLRSHMLIHTNEKPFKCDRCPSAFNRKDKLKRHMLLHAPLKKWKCPLRDVLGCDKEFSRPDKLKAHILRHGGVKNHKCSYCPKAYTRRCFKIAHERTHTDEFRCPRCRKGFESAQRLANHKCRTQEVTSGHSRSRTRASGARVKRARDHKLELSGDQEPPGPLSRPPGVTGPIPLPEGPTMYAIRSGNKRTARARNAAKAAFRKNIAAASRRRAKRSSKVSAPKAQNDKINVEIEMTEGALPPPSGENVTITLVDHDVDVDIEHDTAI